MQALKLKVDPKAPRTFLGNSWPWFATSHEVPWISENYGLNSEGILELSPANLGLLPYVHEIKNRDLLFNYLGLQPVSKYMTSHKYLFIEAPSQGVSFTEIYKPLLKLKDFDPRNMLFVFRRGASLKVVSGDGKFIVKTTDRDWKEKVLGYFDDNVATEITELKVEPGKLLIVKSPYHPRLVGSDAFMVEPGMIGYFKTPENNVTPAYLWWEILLGFISILSLLSYIFRLVRLRQLNPLKSLTTDLKAN